MRAISRLCRRKGLEKLPDAITFIVVLDEGLHLEGTADLLRAKLLVRLDGPVTLREAADELGLPPEPVLENARETLETGFLELSPERS